MVVDATEWVGRRPGLPTGDILIVRASAWAGPSSVCFVISTSALGDQYSPAMNSRQRSMVSPDPILLLAAATSLENVIAENIDQTIQSSAIEYLRQHIGEIKDVDVHGDPHSRLPHIVSFSALHLDSEALATELDKRGFSVGSGSACLSDDGQPSHVLAAMKRLTHGNVRVSIPMVFELSDIQKFVEALKETIDLLRSTSGVMSL
jgi:cysteine desulfurase